MNDIVHVAVAVIVNDADEVCISLRHEHAHQGGLWEFPGGKVESDETVEQALSREIKEELGLDILHSRPLIRIKHDYGDKSVCLHVQKIAVFRGTPVGLEGQDVKWVPIDNLADYDFPEANQAIIKSLSLPHQYLITGTFEDPDDFSMRLKNALDTGIKLVQLRLKSLGGLKSRGVQKKIDDSDTDTKSENDGSRLYRIIDQASALCASHHARLMLNLSMESQRLLGVTDISDIDITFDGVHLDSRTLMSIESVITLKQQAKLVSASCHNVEELQAAEKLGLDFVVLSPVKKTSSHPEAPALGWEQFEKLSDLVSVPVYALGGLSTGDLEEAWSRGAQGVASISGFWPSRQ